TFSARKEMVAGDRIELSTPGFSDRCSTTELPRRSGEDINFPAPGLSGPEPAQGRGGAFGERRRGRGRGRSGQDDLAALRVDAGELLVAAHEVVPERRTVDGLVAQARLDAQPDLGAELGALLRREAPGVGRGEGRRSAEEVLVEAEGLAAVRQVERRRLAGDGGRQP